MMGILFLSKIVVAPHLEYSVKYWYNATLQCMPLTLRAQNGKKKKTSDCKDPYKRKV